MAKFTSLNAAEMAHRSHQSRIMREIETVQAVTPPQLNSQDAGFQSEQLSCMREMIRDIASEIKAENKRSAPDSKRLEQLSRSYATLMERERIAAGRSLPPTLKAKPIPSGQRAKVTELPMPE